jgi:hypothetical protein
MSRERRELNSYTRSNGGPHATWEQEYLQGETGGVFHEEYQATKRLESIDPKAAEYYEKFNEEWYARNSSPDTEWGAENRRNRLKDVYSNNNRTVADPDTTEEELPHNVVRFPVNSKRAYSDLDYRRHSAFNRNFSDHLNRKIDRERGTKARPESGVPGIVWLPPNTTRWGIRSLARQGIWVVTLKLNGLWERDWFMELQEAIDYREIRLKFAGEKV